jgi:hypothetical protein
MMDVSLVLRGLLLKNLFISSIALVVVHMYRESMGMVCMHVITRVLCCFCGC